MIIHVPRLQDSQLSLQGCMRVVIIGGGGGGGG